MDFFVNGYGATTDTGDENYVRYLAEVLAATKGFNGTVQIHLYGGFTNRTDVSEAQCMKRCIQQMGGTLKNAFLHTAEETTTARDNLEHFFSVNGSDRHVIVFCEYTRRWQMMFLASRFTSKYTVRGVRFDQRSLRWDQQLIQLAHCALEIAAWYWPVADKLRVSLRDRKIKRLRGEVR